MTTLSSPPRRLALPLVIWKWLVVIPVLVVSTAVIGSLIIILALLRLGVFASRHLAPLWARLNALFTLVTIDVRGTEHIKPDQSYVIVANHQSLIDIYVIYGFLGVDMKWVMKQELRRVPVLGLACDLMGHVYIDRSRTEAAVASINAARARLTGGTSIIFFPEGTRSRDGRLLPFKKGAFRFAKELGLPILPLTIEGTRHVLPSDTMDWHPGHATLTIHPAVNPDGFDDLTALAEQCRRVIASRLDT